MFYCEICSEWMDCWNDCENCDVWKEKYEDEKKIPFPFQYFEQFFRGELDLKVACDNTVDEVNRLIEEYVENEEE